MYDCRSSFPDILQNRTEYRRRYDLRLGHIIYILYRNRISYRRRLYMHILRIKGCHGYFQEMQLAVLDIIYSTIEKQQIESYKPYFIPIILFYIVIFEQYYCTGKAFLGHILKYILYPHIFNGHIQTNFNTTVWFFELSLLENTTSFSNNFESVHLIWYVNTEKGSLCNTNKPNWHIFSYYRRKEYSSCLKCLHIKL